MGDIRSILLVVLGIAAGVRLANGNKPWSDDPTEPTSPTARPGR